MSGGIRTADTDILSTFGKVGRVDLLRTLFQPLHVAPAVQRELLQAEQRGLSWVAQVKAAVAPLALTASEASEAERWLRLYPQLGSGEMESFPLAQTHQFLCLTNDRQATRVADALGLFYLDLEEILRALQVRNILTTEALAELINQIEATDFTRIKARAQILAE